MSAQAKTPAKSFGVITAFAMKTKRNGGISRDRALRIAERSIADGASDYQSWLAEDIAALSELVGDSIENAGDNINRAYRKAAEIRELGSTFGYALVSRIGGDLCQVLTQISKIEEREKRVIACHIDALRLVGDPKYKGMQADEVPKLLDGLREISERLVGGSKHQTIID